MKYLFLLISIIFVNIAFAQTDTLFKNEKPPHYFTKMKTKELLEKYAFNDTARVMIRLYEKKFKLYKFQAIGSAITLPIGMMIMSSFLQAPNWEVGLYVFFGGAFITVASLPVSIYSLAKMQNINRENLYHDLRYYYLNKKLNSKSKKQFSQINLD